MQDKQTPLEFWKPIEAEALCPCCRKREKIEGCSTCGRCGWQPTLGNFRSELPEAWRRRVDSSMSGLRQRAKALHVPIVAKGTEICDLIIAQEFRCALSGAVLLPDRTSVLGHQVAASRGGSFQVENLFWITYEANRMMMDQSVDAFRLFCRAVVQRSRAGVGERVRSSKGQKAM